MSVRVLTYAFAMSEYRSEIRDSQIAALEAKASSGSYDKYLKRIVLKKVRSFENRDVTLDFPVTALVGPNGGGKTTILGAAGLIYRDVAPSRFFAKSGAYDASMKDWAIEYDLWDRDLNLRIPIQRTASFKSFKWNRKAVNRKVLIFGVSRTVPATERKELTKAAGNKFSATREVEIGGAVVSEVGKILGKEIEGFNRLFVDKTGKVSLFAGRSKGGAAHSEFHFGAGEASVIRMVSAIEGASDQSLILIEEIENGLHPVATRRMVEYLIGVASRKSCQVVFTTHSNDALAPLPSNAIWAAYNGEVLQGKLDVRALRTITGQIDAKLAIFVEDAFAVQMVTVALRYHGRVELDAVKIHGMGGASPAVKVNKQHNVDPTSKFLSVCLVDGDKADLADDEERVYTLPGPGDPESHVFDQVISKLEEEALRLTVSMQLPADQQQRVKDVVQARATTNRDRHVIFQQIGEDLDFTSETVVANAFLAIWAQSFPEEVQALTAGFDDLLPIRS